MPNPVKEACIEIFRECFEGVAPGASGTWFAQGHEAIFHALESLTPGKASLRVPNQTATLGAHAFHLCYYLSMFNAKNRGEELKADWPGSWKIQEFDDSSWKEVSDRTKKEFDEAMIWYRTGSTFIDPEDAPYAVANIAHAAYHLGAMRALIPLEMDRR